MVILAPTGSTPFPSQENMWQYVVNQVNAHFSAVSADIAGKVSNTVAVTAGTGLTGGGALSASRTLAVDFAATGNTTSTTKAETPAGAQAKVEALGDRPGMPKEQAADNTWLEVTVDAAGRISEATKPDGTKYVPILEAGRLAVAGATTTTGTAAGYLDIDVDPAGRIARGIRTDGTNHLPAVDSDRATVGGSSVGTVTTYVVPLLGQSNNLWTWHLAGRPRVRELDDRLRVWVDSGGAVSVVPVTHGESLGIGFAQQFIRDNPNVTVICVPCGEGGTGFIETDKGTWTPGVTPTMGGINFYARALDLIRKALAATPGAQVLATLWSQGEADRYGMNQAQYAAALDSLIGKLRTDLGQPDMPFILGSLVPEEAAAVSQSAGVVAAHEDTPRRVLNTAYVWGPKDGTMFGQRIHFSAPANAERGARMAREGLYRARLNVAGSQPETPRGLRIQRSGTWARIDWDFPPSRATAFTLETSQDSGATWTTQALSTPVTTYKELTTTASQPLWARVSTTNEQGTSLPSMEVRA